MQIIHRTGNLLAAEESVIIHGCNAQGAMGAGVAQAIREEIPVAYDAYIATHQQRGLRLGEVVWAISMQPGRRPRIVGNAITQEFYGNDPKRRYVNYEAIHAALYEVDQFVQRILAGDIQIAVMLLTNRVAMPQLGAGLGGGDWREIAKIIENASVHFQPVVYQL